MAQSRDMVPEKETLLNPDVLPTIGSVAITTLPKYSATASATVTSSTRGKVAVNSRKLEGPYRTKAEKKAATAAVTEKSGNVSEVSLISDFDPEGTPVRSILQGLELPDLASGKIRPLTQQAPTKPIRRDQEIPQAEQAGVSSTGSNSESDDENDNSLADDFRKATEKAMPWCHKNLCKMAVSRPHLRPEVLWNRLVGEQRPTEPFATAFVQAIKASRWSHKKALDALNGKIAKLYY
jgi:hypothetical protein